MTASMLPAEIWLHICRQLCVHCDHEKMPDFSFPEPDFNLRPLPKTKSDYQHGTSALAALSLTSRWMRDLSQPTLHHCFYDYPHENKTSKFLRTLISQPRLANSVRVLALPKWGDRGYEYNVRSEIETWNELGNRLGISSPRWINRLLADDSAIFVPAFERPVRGPGEEDTSMPPDVKLLAFDGLGANTPIHIHLTGRTLNFFRDLSLWKQYLLIGLCSKRLTHLAVSSIYNPVQDNGQLFADLLGPSQPLQGPFDFPNLRVFSCQTAFFEDDFPSFFSLAPRLNRVAMGSIHWPRLALARLTAPTPLNNVRSLSLACNPHNFVDVLKLCGGVEDLEFHIDIRRPYSSSVPIPDPWPASIKQDIRRLCWSTTMFTGYDLLSREGSKLFPPLQEFRNLEILEMDRSLLERWLRLAQGLDPYELDGIYPGLADFLPPSIRILHFSFGRPYTLSWSLLILELESLAAAKMTFLPMLSIIQIDEYMQHTEQKPVSQVMRILGVVKAMKHAGIELRFGLEPTFLDLLPGQGMRSPLPGSLNGPYEHFSARLPREHFFLQK